MSAHKCPTPNPIAERFRFNTCNRESTELVATYIAELQTLTEHYDYGESLDSMLRDMLFMLVCGINYERIQRCLLSEGATLTVEKGIDIAQAMKSSRQSAVIQTYQQKSRDSVINKVTSKPRESTSRECYCCGSCAHLKTWNFLSQARAYS